MGHPQNLVRGQERIRGRIGPQDENANAKAITTEDTENTEKCVTEQKAQVMSEPFDRRHGVGADMGEGPAMSSLRRSKAA